MNHKDIISELNEVEAKMYFVRSEIAEGESDRMGELRDLSSKRTQLCDKLLICYSETLAGLCAYIACAQKYIQLQKDYEMDDISLENIELLVQGTSILKERLETIKGKLGFPGGCDFLSDDTNFDGFKLVGGMFEGSKPRAMLIIHKWLKAFGKDNFVPYQFEVATLVLFLCGQDLSKVHVFGDDFKRIQGIKEPFYKRLCAKLFKFCC